MIFIKKVYRFIEEQLVDMYIIALDSFVPKEKAISMNDLDYIAIDMSSKFFDNISQKGLTSSVGNDVDLISNDKKGILLGILSRKIISKTEVVIEGYWFFTSIASEGIRTRVMLKDG